MSIYAQDTSVSVERSRAEIEGTLAKYGANRFGYMTDDSMALIGFVMNGKAIKFCLPLPNNTLRRVRSFSHGWGFNTFVMTNVFAFRATKPKDMHRAIDPVGPANSAHLIATAGQCERAILCWGTKNNFPVTQRHQAATTRILVRNTGCRLFSLGYNDDGSPKHPLYVLGTAQPVEVQA